MTLVVNDGKELRAPIKQYRKLQIVKYHRAVHDLPIELNPAGRTTLAVQIYRELGGDRNRGLASGAKLPSGELAAQLDVSQGTCTRHTNV